MVRVMKSPNMMSTTGRSPVIAAPTARPVKPASEMGVSITRSMPNSSTRPDKTLNGVPASATSSPRMHTRESRRISSASASRTASARVNSRRAVSGIDVLLHFLGTGIRRRHCELDGLFHLGPDLRLNAIEECGVSVVVFHHPRGHILDRIALGDPFLLFLLRAIILPVDVADVMPAVTVGVAHQESRALAGARAVDQPGCRGVHGAHVLAINGLRLQSKGGGTRGNVPRRGLRKMCVLGIK